jgi:hypothetical protein
VMGKGTFGICKLCLMGRWLQKSHYIPAALYATPKKLEFATVESTGFVDEHIRVPLLCESCEGLFDRNGEQEVLRHIAAKSFKRFPLAEKLKLALPREEYPDLSRFCGTELGMDMDKFAYFALSVVWRGQFITGRCLMVRFGHGMRSAILKVRYGGTCLGKRRFLPILLSLSSCVPMKKLGSCPQLLRSTSKRIA